MIKKYTIQKDNENICVFRGDAYDFNEVMGERERADVNIKSYGKRKLLPYKYRHLIAQEERKRQKDLGNYVIIWKEE